MANKDAFFFSTSLKNRIIYSDTLNETEFLRTLAKQGVNTLGLRVMNSYDLSLYILSKLGISEKRRYLSNKEQDFVYYAILKPDSFNDASNVRAAINSFRDSGKGNSFEELEPFLNNKFVKKLESIKKAFVFYNDYKEKENLYDIYDLLYRIKSYQNKLSEEVIYFKELPYSSLAVEAFSNIFNLKEKSFLDIKDQDEQQIDIHKCFGKGNEFACLLNKIADTCINFDKCLVVLTNPSDITGLINRFIQYNIPFSSSIGYPFGQTNVGKLIAKIKMMKAMQFGVDAYKGLFDAPYFNKENYLSSFTSEKSCNNFVKYVGWLKPSFEKDQLILDPSLYSPSMFVALQNICGDINNSKDKYYEFIEKNVSLDEYNYEALSLLKNYLDQCEQYDVPFDVVVDSLLSSTVSQHISHSGAVHISSLSQAFSSLREHLFVVGLDSSFPGNPKENYLIYDEEYQKMGVDQYVSSEIVSAKKKMMDLLIDSSKNAHLSYSYFNSIDVKEINPSSVIYQRINDEKDIVEFSYEQDDLSLNKGLITNYNRGAISETIALANTYKYDAKEILNREYRPSSFGDFFTNKLAFILNVIFKINIDEPDDPYLVYSPSEKGTLFHKVMENFDKSKISEIDFVNKGLQMFDDFIKTKPSIIHQSMLIERNSFKKGLTNCYRNDPNRRCFKAEEEISDCLVYGLKFKGTPDRIEKIDINGVTKYVLVDYKTGSKLKHKDEDPLSCLQGLIYAEMIKQKYHINIDYCEFRYPFVNDSVTITINSDTDKALKGYIDQFVSAINNHAFSCLEEEYEYVDKYECLISLMKELRQ